MGNWPPSFTDPESKLGKRVPIGKIYVSSGVELSRDSTQLLWPTRLIGHGKYVIPTGGMFNRFVTLYDATPTKIHQFAQTWGSLHVDSNGRFFGRCYAPFRGRGRPFVMPHFSVEPIEAWRYFSRRAKSVLSVAGNLQEGKRGGAENWAALSNFSARISPRTLPGVPPYPFLDEETIRANDLGVVNDCTLDDQRSLLSLEVDFWMKLTGLGLAHDRKLEIDYEGRLLAAVALQLSLTVSGADALFICSGCSHPYVRSKKSPNPGALNFCDACGRPEAVRQADERRRQKIQKARRLHSQGVLIDEITDQLRVRRAATVRRWIKKGK